MWFYSKSNKLLPNSSGLISCCFFTASSTTLSSDLSSDFLFLVLGSISNGVSTSMVSSALSSLACSYNVKLQIFRFSYNSKLITNNY